MKNKKALIAIISLLVLVAAAAACWLAFGPKTVEGSKTITVEVTHKDGTVNVFDISTDAEYLRGAMEQENLIGGSSLRLGDLTPCQFLFNIPFFKNHFIFPFFNDFLCFIQGFLSFWSK